MHSSRTKTWISFLLVAAGAVLLFLGAREFLGSHFGQMEARNSFGQSAPAAASLPAPKQGETVARLYIPRLDAEIYIVEGDGPSELRAGPGHLSDTAPPGTRGNCVIAGHRDTHFRVLKDIQKGDDIIIETRTGQYLYQVRNTSIVTPENTTALNPSPDPQLHLITCYPFYFVGPAPKRFVVEARLAGAVGRTS